MLSLLRVRNNLLFNTNKCFINEMKLKPKESGITRSFVKKAIQQNEHNFSETPSFKSLIKPFLFTVGFSGSVYTVCIVWNFENSLVLRQKFNNWNNDWKQSLYSFQENQNSYRKAGNIRNQLNEWWNSRTNGFKLFSAIAAINGLVFIGWRIPRLVPLMSEYFMTSVSSNSRHLKCWPMLLSTFSHYSATHLILNLVVLHSFTQIGVQLFGIEQFLALYLSSGVISSFTSYFAKVLTARTGSSLGASGAILGILSSCCIARPDLQLVIIFLPFFTLSAGTALKGIIMMDTAGLVLGWRLFDHSAHLGGALFGVWYTMYGQNVISNNKKVIINVWQKIRNKIV